MIIQIIVGSAIGYIIGRVIISFINSWNNKRILKNTRAKIMAQDYKFLIPDKTGKVKEVDLKSMIQENPKQKPITRIDKPTDLQIATGQREGRIKINAKNDNTQNKRRNTGKAVRFPKRKKS